VDFVHCSPEEPWRKGEALLRQGYVGRRWSWRGCSLHSPSLGFSPENTKQPPCCAGFFCLFAILLKTSFQRLAQSKNPLAGVFVCCFNVELAGQKSKCFEEDLLKLVDLKNISDL